MHASKCIQIMMVFVSKRRVMNYVIVLKKMYVTLHQNAILWKYNKHYTVYLELEETVESIATISSSSFKEKGDDAKVERTFLE